MAENPFAKYAEPAANPFAKYAEPAPVRSEIPQGRTYAASEVPGAALENIGPSASEFYGGMLQMVTSPVQTARGVQQLGAGIAARGLQMLPESMQRAATLKPVTEPFMSPEQQAAIGKFTQQEIDQAINVANSVGGMYADRYGGYENIKRTIAEDPVGAAADLASLLTLGGAAATRAGARVAGSKLRTAGAYTDPTALVVKPVEKALQFGGDIRQIATNALDPKSAAYLTAAGSQGPQLVNALMQPSEIVPGSVPTAAQAASGVGSPSFARMGESSRAVLPNEYYARAAQQEQAQLAALRRIEGEPGDIARFEAARQAETGPLYDLAEQAVVPSDKAFTQLMQRPSMKRVMAKARELAAEEDRVFQIGKNAPAETVPSTLLGPDGKPLPPTIIPEQFAQYPGRSLQQIKFAFDDLLKATGEGALGKNEKKALAATREEFLNWVEKKIPEYQMARERFAEMSVPIDRARVGQILTQRFTPALGEGTAALRGAALAEASRDAPRLLKRATGESRYKELTDVLTPEQVKILDDVKKDVARIKTTEQQVKAARGAGPDVSLVGTEALKNIQAPNLMDKVVTVANYIVRRLQGKLDSELAVEIATEMLYPQKAGAALQKALLREARIEAALNPFRAAGRAVRAPLRTPALVGATPEILNAMSEQESQNALAR